eukprot:6194821-Pleurochrysis_carterae.AAC.1
MLRLEHFHLLVVDHRAHCAAGTRDRTFRLALALALALARRVKHLGQRLLDCLRGKLALLAAKQRGPEQVHRPAHRLVLGADTALVCLGIGHRL